MLKSELLAAIRNLNGHISEARDLQYVDSYSGEASIESEIFFSIEAGEENVLFLAKAKETPHGFISWELHQSVNFDKHLGTYDDVDEFIAALAMTRKLNSYVMPSNIRGVTIVPRYKDEPMIEKAEILCALLPSMIEAYGAEAPVFFGGFRVLSVFTWAELDGKNPMEVCDMPFMGNQIYTGVAHGHDTLLTSLRRNIRHNKLDIWTISNHSQHRPASWPNDQGKRWTKNATQFNVVADKYKNIKTFGVPNITVFQAQIELSSRHD